jgi:hypothetical protein
VRTTVYAGALRGAIIPGEDGVDDKAGWHVDNKPGQASGWYGFHDDGDGEFTKWPGTLVRPYNPAIKNQPALLGDYPEPGEADRKQEFITAAVIKGGKNDGKVLGCIDFAQRTDAEGDWDKNLLPPVFFNYPPPCFFSAVAIWNKKPGKTPLPKLTGDPAAIKGAPKKSAYE